MTLVQAAAAIARSAYPSREATEGTGGICSATGAGSADANRVSELATTNPVGAGARAAVDHALSAVADVGIWTLTTLTRRGAVYVVRVLAERTCEVALGARPKNSGGPISRRTQADRITRHQFPIVAGRYQDISDGNILADPDRIWILVCERHTGIGAGRHSRRLCGLGKRRRRHCRQQEQKRQTERYSRLLATHPAHVNFLPPRRDTLNEFNEV